MRGCLVLSLGGSEYIERVVVVVIGVEVVFVSLNQPLNEPQFVCRPTVGHGGPRKKQLQCATQIKILLRAAAAPSLSQQATHKAPGGVYPNTLVGATIVADLATFTGRVDDPETSSTQLKCSI